MSESLKRKNNGRIRAAAFLTATLLTGCGSEAPIDYSDPAFILGGDTSWGSVRIRQQGDNCIKGDLPWGKVALCEDGNKITGDSPWGPVNATNDNGHVTGDLPWGDMDVTINGETVMGNLPWGDVHLEVAEGAVTGSLPWGETELRFGDSHRDITEPLSAMAIVAVMSDKV